MAVITVSRQAGTGGDDLAQLLTATLGFYYIDRREILRDIDQWGLLEDGGQFFQQAGKGQRTPSYRSDNLYHTLVAGMIFARAGRENLVILGCGSQFLFQGLKNSFRILCIAPRNRRIINVSRKSGLSKAESQILVDETDHQRGLFLKKTFGGDWLEAVNYDLVLSSPPVSPDRGVKIILEAMEAKKISPKVFPSAIDRQRRQMRIPKISFPKEAFPKPGEGEISFAHSSEEEFSRVLDYYRIRWEYEPKSFPIAWDQKGKVSEWFTPDFYLPDLDLFIELTTMKQSLVTKKNRKVRRIHELYPEIAIKLFYRRDFKRLLVKYGLQ